MQVVDALRSHLSLDFDLAIEDSGRLLYDDDFDDNAHKSLDELGIKTSLRVVADCDPDGIDQYSIMLFLQQGSSVEIVGQLTKSSRKRRAVEEEVEEPVAKKAKVEEQVVVIEDDMIVID